jgi:hypothetical protein
MFGWTLRTIKEAITFSKTMEREVIIWKLFAQVFCHLSFIFIYLNLSGYGEDATSWETALYVGVMLGSGIFAYVCLPVAHFLYIFGLKWETDEWTKTRKEWWDRLEHLHKPVLVDGKEMVYIPERDAYELGFYLSRSLMKEIKTLSVNYETDVAGVVDIALGLARLQDEARTKNTERLMIAKSDQPITKQSVSSKDVS